MERLRKLGDVVDAQPISDDFIYIQRKDEFAGEERPPFTTAIVSAMRVTRDALSKVINGANDCDFVANVPKGAIWEGSAIEEAGANNLGWGGIGELMSALGEANVRGFQRKEFAFVLRGLEQHTNVAALDRLYDRLIEIHRHSYEPLKAVLLNEYELTAEHIRRARSVYGQFAAIVRTNPNGGATTDAKGIAKELGAEIFQWGEFLGRLNRR